MTNEQIHDLAALYAVDALDDADRRSFEEHLEGCAACRDEVADLAEPAAALAYAAPALEPPVELRGRILDAARAERPNVVPLRRHSRRVVIAGAVLAAAAAIAIAVGLTAALRGGGAPAARTVALTGAEGTLLVRPNGHAQLNLVDLAEAPAGKAYEIWVIEDGGSPRPAGTFPGGAPATVVEIGRTVPKGATVAVTLEREPGATLPTTPIIISATAPA